MLSVMLLVMVRVTGGSVGGDDIKHETPDQDSVDGAQDEKKDNHISNEKEKETYADKDLNKDDEGDVNVVDTPPTTPKNSPKSPLLRKSSSLLTCVPSLRPRNWLVPRTKKVVSSEKRVTRMVRR